MGLLSFLLLLVLLESCPTRPTQNGLKRWGLLKTPRQWRTWVRTLSYFFLASKLIDITAGADTVRSTLSIFRSSNLQFWRYRQSRPFSHFSWQWQCTPQFRRRPKQKLMLSLGPVVCPTSMTVAPFPTSTHLWKNPCVGNLLFRLVSFSLPS